MTPSTNNGKCENRHIPEHFLHQKIFPLLPFKSLCRFKLLSKEAKSFIEEDTRLALDQYRSSSSVFAFLAWPSENNDLCPQSLSFFPNPYNTIGVPDPELRYLKNPMLVASSNGLLLFYLNEPSLTVCVCNPATQEKTIIPDYGRADMRHQMGLAYDPSSPDRYTIVCPFHWSLENGTEFQFEVFRSETREWVLSDKILFTPDKFRCSLSPIYAQGKIYWSQYYYLIWYDVEKDTTGCIKLNNRTMIPEISTFNGLVTYCVMGDEGIEGWVLTDGAQWEKYLMTWDDLSEKNVAELQICEIMRLYHDYAYYVCKWRRVWPLTFDGRNAYVAVLKTPIDEKAVVFQCDLISGKVIETKARLANRKDFRVVEYKNSMVRVPC